VSVYPQEVIWRAFMFHRYRSLFRRRWAIIGASAIAFGHAHIVFHNWLAVGLCVIGGVLFARTFDRSRSTLAAWIDHALYGCLVFTIGIGRYFYSGSVGAD
jgi:membrane protease YdiL (CAAX protease family)